MITYMQKEYTKSDDVIQKTEQELERDRIYDFEVDDKVSKNYISISANLGNLEIWIPQDLEFSQYSIDDYIRELLPYAYTNVRFESNIYKMSVKGKLNQTQYVKLIKHIIKEAEFVVIVNRE